MTNITIFGSCVTRDAFSYPTANRISIDKYYSRTSLISQFGEKVPIEIDLDLPSDFKTRVVFEDINRIFAKELPKIKSDYLLIDFIDERCALYQIDESYIVISSELKNMGILPKLNGKTIYRNTMFTEDLSLMRQAVERFVTLVKEFHLEKKIILHECFLASEYTVEDRDEIFLFDEEEQIRISEMNKRLKNYYEVLKELLPQLRVITQSGVASEANRWGKAPYHFEDSYYNGFISQLELIIAKDNENDDVVVELNDGNKIFCHNRDEYISNIIYETKNYYEIVNLERWQKYIHESTYVFDIGANIGNHSLYWLNKLAKLKKIISFEPMHENFEKLSKNFKQKSDEKWLIYNMIVSNQKGYADLKSLDYTNMGTASFEKSKHGEYPMVRIDDFLIKEGFKLSSEKVFVKIDTEGFEMDVLEGMSLLIEIASPIIWVEVTEDTWERVYDLLDKHSYKLVDYIGLNYLFIKNGEPTNLYKRFLRDNMNSLIMRRSLMAELEKIKK